MTGISAFASLEYLDPITEAFPHDIMHDFLGIVPIVLTCLIRHLNVSGTVTINELNCRICIWKE